MAFEHMSGFTSDRHNRPIMYVTNSGGGSIQILSKTLQKTYPKSKFDEAMHDYKILTKKHYFKK